jgi:hypothetical protein
MGLVLFSLALYGSPGKGSQDNTGTVKLNLGDEMLFSKSNLLIYKKNLTLLVIILQC